LYTIAQAGKFNQKMKATIKMLEDKDLGEKFEWVELLTISPKYIEHTIDLQWTT